MQDQAMNALEQSICPPCRAPPPLRLCEFGIYDATDGAPTSQLAAGAQQPAVPAPHLRGRLAEGGEDYALWVCVNLGAAASCIYFVQ